MHDLIQDQLHMSPWCFEIDGASEKSASLEVLSRRIGEADLVLCIIGADYGSELGHEPISFTEWELQTAIHHQKEMKLYVEESSPSRDSRLASLLTILSDELVGHFVARFCSLNDLCRKVARDLSAWQASHWNRSRRLTGDLGNATVLPFFSRILRVNQREGLSGSRSPCVLPVGNALHNLHVLKDRGDYSSAYDCALPIFLSVTEDAEFFARANADLRSLAEFFSVFSNVLAVRNEIRCGAISAVVAAKAEFKLQQLLDDKAGLVTSASAVSGILNMAGLRNQALSWNTFALERSQYVACPSSIWDSRSSILRSQRRLVEAEQSLLYAIALSDGTNDDRGYMYSRLAGIQFSLGKQRDAQRNFDRASSLVKSEGLGRAILARELLPILIATREMKEAENQYRTARALCKRLGLERPRRSLAEAALKGGISTD